MSHILIPGAQTRIPLLPYTGSSALASVTLNATGETCVFAGSVILENPFGGSKTISSAGGGKIVWRSGTTTFANGSTTFDIGLQDISTASSPTQGDGVFDVKASFTGGGGGITSAAVQTSAMTSGSKTIAHGDMVAMVFSMVAAGGADSVIVTVNQNNAGLSMANGFPAVTDNTGGSYARVTPALPNAYIIFDDNTIGWFYGSWFDSASRTNSTYNSGTGTADEYGNFIQYPFTFQALGLHFAGQVSGNSADAELLLYSDPLGTPSVQRTITLDATQWPVTATALSSSFLFSTPITLKANTPYGISLRPTTANNVSLAYRDVDNTTGGKAGDVGTNNYAIRRLDNTGAFSDFNGGTAKTRQMGIAIVGSYMGQEVNLCNYQLGI